MQTLGAVDYPSLQTGVQRFDVVVVLWGGYMGKLLYTSFSFKYPRTAEAMNCEPPSFLRVMPSGRYSSNSRESLTSTSPLLMEKRKACVSTRRVYTHLARSKAGRFAPHRGCGHTQDVYRSVLQWFLGLDSSEAHKRAGWSRYLDASVKQQVVFLH